VISEALLCAPFAGRLQPCANDIGRDIGICFYSWLTADSPHSPSFRPYKRVPARPALMWRIIVCLCVCVCVCRAASNSRSWGKIAPLPLKKHLSLSPQPEPSLVAWSLSPTNSKYSATRGPEARAKASAPAVRGAIKTRRMRASARAHSAHIMYYVPHMCVRRACAVGAATARKRVTQRQRRNGGAGVPHPPYLRCLELGGGAAKPPQFASRKPGLHRSY
jgi:hypothetical protein